MFNRDNGNDGHTHPLGFERHIDNDLVDAAVREQQKAIGWAEHEVAQDHLAKPLHMLEEHRLALSVRADHEVVKRQGKLDNRVKAREAAMAREHLFDEDARVSRAEEMDETIACNGLRTKLGGALDVVHLGRFDAVEDRFRLCDVIKRSNWHVHYPYLKNYSILSCDCLQELTLE